MPWDNSEKNKIASLLVYVLIVIGVVGYLIYDYNSYRPTLDKPPSDDPNSRSATSDGSIRDTENEKSSVDIDQDTSLSPEDSHSEVAGNGTNSFDDFFTLSLPSASAEQPLPKRSGTVQGLAKSFARQARSERTSKNGKSGGNSNGGTSGGAISGSSPSPMPSRFSKENTYGKYWLETAPGEFNSKRHNSSCPRFRNYPGRNCTSVDGTPCPLCGG